MAATVPAQLTTSRAPFATNLAWPARLPQSVPSFSEHYNHQASLPSFYHKQSDKKLVVPGDWQSTHKCLFEHKLWCEQRWLLLPVLEFARFHEQGKLAATAPCLFGTAISCKSLHGCRNPFKRAEWTRYSETFTWTSISPNTVQSLSKTTGLAEKQTWYCGLDTWHII